MNENFTPNQNQYKNMTPFKTWLKYQINTWGLNSFPFVESDFDDLTNYGMLMKMMKAVNDVIANENLVEQDMTNLFTAFTQLQTYLFNEFADYKNEVDDEIEQFETSITNDFNNLHDYVNNYFDNLDVQEEINNKLDEMVEDGTLTQILGDYFPFVTPIMYGAVGDGITDDTNAFKQAIASNKPIYIPNGNYLITDNLIVNQNITGEDQYKTNLIFSGLDSNTYALTLNIGYLKLENFRISSTDNTSNVGTSITYNGINTTGKLYIELNKLYISNFNRGLNLGINSWNNIFKTLYIYSCNEGIYLADECNDNSFYDCLIKKCTKGFYKIAGTSVNIYGGDISYNDKGIVLEGHGDLNILNTYFELNVTNSISCTWGISAFEKISVKNCSFTENNNTTKIFYFNGNSSSKAIIENCFFRNVGETNITMCQYQSSQFKPLFINNMYNNTFTIDETKADYITMKNQGLTFLTTDQFTFTANGIGYQSYTTPTTPSGYTLLTKEFIRTDSNSYNLVVTTPYNLSYLTYYSGESISVTGYMKFTYIKI